MKEICMIISIIIIIIIINRKGRAHEPQFSAPEMRASKHLIID
jgi:hypothetical protein